MASDRAILNNSSIVSTRMIPALLKAASNTKSFPAKLPVWDIAAWAPSELFPDFRTMIGLFLAKDRAALKKFLAFINDSI